MNAPAYQSPDGRVALHLGDMREVMAAFPEASVDAVITDPPYDLTSVSRNGSSRTFVDNPYGRTRVGTDRRGFMGRTWDGTGIAFEVETWERVLRVLKPGGHLLSFGGTRTWHRMACAIEDAGFEIRDQIATFSMVAWVYGSGFPKSLDVGKAIDRHLGAERERKPSGRAPSYQRTVGNTRPWMEDPDYAPQVDEPATPEAAAWQGWGTALKPAWEPIVVGRKLLDGTVAANVLAHGTGALNIDAGRIGVTKQIPASPSQHEMASPNGWGFQPETGDTGGFDPNLGRWPANAVLIHADECQLVGKRRVRTNVCGDKGGTTRARQTEFGMTPGARDYADPDGREEVDEWRCVPGCPVAALDEQSGDTRSGGSEAPVWRQADQTRTVYGEFKGGPGPNVQHSDRGGASRFMYTAKADRAERRGSNHPTIKPLDLMRWLVRLVTPPDGLVLDPFCGSGSTLEAAYLQGFRAVGVDQDEASLRDVAARIIQGVLM